MNLKKLTGLKGIALAIVSGTFLLASCSKEVNGDAAAASDEALLQQTAVASISDTALVKFFSAPFSSRGSRTDYRGAVTDTTAVISLDYFIEKKFSKAGEKKLFINYADGGLSGKGWQYEMSFDKKTGAILLAPNSVMESQIVPGSFKVITATFDRFTSTFNFFTEVKETSNGIVHQVFEIVTKQ